MRPATEAARLLALVAGLGVSAVADETVVRVGLHDAQPVAFREDGEARGFLIDVIEHIADEEGWELEYVYGSWEECMARLERAEIDMLFPILPNAERSSRFDFNTEPMFQTWGRVFAPPDAPVHGLEDLEGKTVAVVAEDIFYRAFDELTRNLEVRPEFLPLASRTEVFQAVRDGDADAAALEGMSGYWNADAYGLAAMPLAFHRAAPRVAVPKGRGAHILSAIDRHLPALKDDSSSVYRESYDQWLGSPLSTLFRTRVQRVGLALAGLLVVVGLFSFVLKSQVKSRTRELTERNVALEQEIVERERAERERAGLEEQLRQSQKMEAVGQLASGVAHDFRNLLTVLSAHADRIKEQLPRDSAILESVDVMERSVQQAATVTRSLLTFSRKVETVRRPVSLREVLVESSRLLERTLPARVQLDVSLSTDPEPWVNGDATQLQQVILNLALNARDAMSDGGTLFMCVEPPQPASSGRGTTTRLVIRDSGCGIPAHLASRIFEPFFTTKSRDRGTGLGLATVQGIVAAHDGALEVESQPGVGTTITVTLPCLTSAVDDAVIDEEDAVVSGRGELILLAEDNQQIRQIVTASLHSFGYEVVQASHGEELLRRFDEHGDRIQAYVLDLDLPGRSGLDALRIIRERDGQAPAILMTGSADATLDDRLDVGTVLLNKPFRMTRLGTLVRSLLDGEGGGDGARPA